MELWKIYLAGLIITFITGELLQTESWNGFFRNRDFTSILHWKEKIIVVLISISVIIVGGMTVGRFQAELIVRGRGILEILMITSIVTICTYGFISWVLKFDEINKKTRIFFKVIFIISLLFWGPYLTRYYGNIEIIKEKKLVSKKVEEVVYFSLRDSHINCLYSEGNEEKDIYVDIHDAKINVDDNIEEAYVEIYSYTVTKKKINNNNGKEEILNESEVIKYDFYLNSKVMK